MYHEHNIDSDMIRVLQLIQELSEQNARNKEMSAKLVGMSAQLKNEAADISSGFSLRRFNVNLSNETFESELERANAQIIIENQSLTYENQQLSHLLKEHEMTMETILTKFRSHAAAAQRHEVTLTQHYENLILSRETSPIHLDIANNTSIAQSLDRLSQNLRSLFHSMAGEDPQSQSPALPSTSDAPDSSSTSSSSTSSSSSTLSSTELLDTLLSTQQDWALERESEITRLEEENEQLRKVLGIDKGSAEKNGWLEDEERELAYTKSYTPIPTLHARRRSMSSSVSISSPSGLSMGIGGGGGFGGGPLGGGMGGGGGLGAFGGFGGMGGLGGGIGRSGSPGANTITVPSNATSSLILRPAPQGQQQGSQPSPFTINLLPNVSSSGSGLGNVQNTTPVPMYTPSEGRTSYGEFLASLGGGAGRPPIQVPSSTPQQPPHPIQQSTSPPLPNANTNIINLTPSSTSSSSSSSSTTTTTTPSSTTNVQLTTPLNSSMLGMVPPRSDSMQTIRSGPPARRSSLFTPLSSASGPTTASTSTSISTPSSTQNASNSGTGPAGMNITVNLGGGRNSGGLSDVVMQVLGNTGEGGQSTTGGDGQSSEGGERSSWVPAHEGLDLSEGRTPQTLQSVH